jgi:hypothetical protein
MYSLINLYFLFCFCFLVTYYLTTLTIATPPLTYGLTTIFFMPVTTRWCAKLLPGIATDISNSSSSDSTLLLETLNTTTTTIPIVIASNIFNPLTTNYYSDVDQFSTTSSSSSPNDISLTTTSLSLVSTDFEISKFLNFILFGAV